MTDRKVNRLGGSRSAYLRSAMHQPVQWNEWGTESFARAAAEDKPILLDIGATWCHWCRVMDGESYEDPETARLINEHFIPMKVDRDERPDVDARYQAAVAAISGQGGWPLTVFLTPGGKPYFGGTYFPVMDGHGRPGLRRVLMTMAEAFEKQRGEVEETGDSVMAAIEDSEQLDGSGDEPGPESVAKVVEAVLKLFDPRFGGFGSQPKFPQSAALDLLLDVAGRGGEQASAAREAAAFTLRRMASGGVYDHLGGGFHRYSVDERWVVPHFEKMSYSNSELLRNYAHSFAAFGNSEDARIAREIVGWVNEVLSDREQGGFFASQDANVSVEDNGDYFTWTRAEAAAVLSVEEMEVAGRHWDIGELGDMHHRPEKNVLHHSGPILHEDALAIVAEAKRKLYTARKMRTTPYVDRTVYVGWNGMMISAFLEAGRVLGDTDTTAFGGKTLDRVLKDAWDPESGSLGHVVQYGEGVQAGERVAGGLEDYVFLGHAALDAWESTGEMRYFEVALALGEQCVLRFFDGEKAGFFDTEGTEAKLGALSARRKPIQDAPTPSGNAVGAALLLRLADFTGRKDLRGQARATLACFAGVAEHLGLYAASYALTVERMVNPMVNVMVVGGDLLADEMEREALRGYSVNKSVVRLREEGGRVPPLLAEAMEQVADREGSFAMVCTAGSWRHPVGTVEELAASLVGLR